MISIVPKTIRRQARSLRHHGMRIAGWLAAATPVLTPILLDA